MALDVALHAEPAERGDSHETLFKRTRPEDF